MTEHGIADFDVFVRDHGQRLRAVVTAIAHGRHDVDDLLQEGLARAYEKRATFVSEQHAVNFVCHVVRCLLVDDLRSWYRRNVVATADLVAAADEDPAQVVVTTDECRRAVRSLAALPEEHRQLLWDHVVEGDSYAEIARRTATPLATVRSTAHRARLAVLHRMREAGDYVAGIPALARGALCRWRAPMMNGEYAAAAAVAITLLFAGAGSAPAQAADAPVLHQQVATVPVARVVPHPVRPVRPVPQVRPAPRVAPRPASLLRSPSPDPKPDEPAKALPVNTVDRVRFTGTYSRTCAFTTPTGHGRSIGGERYRYDCTITGHSTFCAGSMLPDPFDCTIELEPTIDRGYLDAYGQDVLGDGVCRYLSRDGADAVASRGWAVYDGPSGPPVRIPLQVRSKAGAQTTQMVGDVDVAGVSVYIVIEVPFSCAEVVDDATGLTGETTYREPGDLM